VIRVEVAHVNVDTRELDFRIVKRLSKSKRERPEARGPKKTERPRGKSLDERGKRRVPHGSVKPRKKGRRR
jgi:hypothetical protein